MAVYCVVCVCVIFGFNYPVCHKVCVCACVCVGMCVADIQHVSCEITSQF